MTTYTTKNIPSGMWTHWRRLTPHDKTLGPRSRNLYAADVACKRKHGMGLLEYLKQNEIITDEDITNALDLDPPDD